MGDIVLLYIYICSHEGSSHPIHPNKSTDKNAGWLGKAPHGGVAVSPALACLLVAAAAPAWAATCDITLQSVSFGAYDPTQAGDLDGVGTISIDCDVEVSVTITMSTGAAGSYAARTMAGGADHIRYNLFTGPQRVVVWGGRLGRQRDRLGDDAIAGLQRLRRHPGRSDVPAGAYAGTIVVTIAY